MITATDTGCQGAGPVDPGPPPIGSALSLNPTMGMTAKRFNVKQKRPGVD